MGAIIRRDNPVQLLAISIDDRVLAVLPNAGLSDPALQNFAAAAGIRFEHEVNPGWSAMVDRYPPRLRRTPDFRRCVR
ncbi:MAG: hypothetical protein INR72_16020 [Williamsia herbipolensis]|uniref:Uncharacterized protein n=1 Tax=Williamsia serinedens TaxID=391736 RepID=A0ABT1H2Z1_9NOCA|nr:hypothetical protein [Williamsia serinedens]MBE7162746.1 hypothetical protein [Williamsia herbipolensis]MCP2161608.1 hypothetical protein [Williamsia serinedens]